MNAINQSISRIRLGINIYIACILLTFVLSFFALFGFIAMTFLGSIIDSLLIFIVAVPTLGVFIGLAIYYSGLRKFKSQLDVEEQKSINQVSSGVLVLIIVNIISIIGILAMILTSVITRNQISIISINIISNIVSLATLVSYLIIYIGFNSLSGSRLFSSPLAQKGVKQLSSSALFALIGTALQFIPYLGMILSLIMMLLFITFHYLGWSKINLAFSEEQIDLNS